MLRMGAASRSRAVATGSMKCGRGEHGRSGGSPSVKRTRRILRCAVCAEHLQAHAAHGKGRRSAWGAQRAPGSGGAKRGGKGGASFGSFTALCACEPRESGAAAEGTEDLLFQPEGWPEARSVWRVREPDAEGWRPCGCALERLNVRIMKSLCDVEPVAGRRSWPGIPARSRTARQQSPAAGRPLVHCALRFHCEAEPALQERPAGALR
jgi:hypothetical protein